MWIWQLRYHHGEKKTLLGLKLKPDKCFKWTTGALSAALWHPQPEQMLLRSLMGTSTSRHMSAQSRHCSARPFSHLHSPAFLAFLSSLPLHLTCCTELRDQLGATERSHHWSEHCEDLIQCVSRLRGAVPSAGFLEMLGKLVFLCNCYKMLAYVRSCIE